MKNNCDFFVGKIIKLNNKTIDVKGSEKLHFYVCAVDDNQHEYSLEFNSKITKSALLKLDINEKINFDSYNDIYDVIFWYDRIYNPSVDFNMFITKYLPNKFMLVITFYDDDFYGKIELAFEL